MPLDGCTVTFVATAGGGGTIGDVDANVPNSPADVPLRVASGRYFHAMMFTSDPGRATSHAEAIDEQLSTRSIRRRPEPAALGTQP